MTVEEAQFFYKMLNKKINRTTVEKHIRLARNAELKQKGFLFRVDRVKRKHRPEDDLTIDAIGLPLEGQADEVHLINEKEQPDIDRISEPSKDSVI
eukprot:CAMPEP_0170510422 /NCGR_PEP_ID=MMETSP0208-20121228/65756_1 /TAXON_ID=197538 /ORGANISM="Strombidium inclinatum, Strain S3" /LENGTH=95 /DNA_ID=CAMNT_0010793879 /DNA_START=166 /DNA_END=453 /DNA_ORIENTATION=+